ncbi:MAG: acyltransferase, partial [Prevotella sp.]|nr:acyltransferase [Prevotella sp.]
MTRNHNIDRLRLLCAVLVIVIHTGYGGCRSVVEPLVRCAVPCFFIISGFLIYNPLQISDNNLWGEKLKRNINKILYITLWSNLLYAVVGHILSRYPHTDGYAIRRLGAIVFLSGSPFALHLWYLSAYLYVLAIVYCLWRYNKMCWRKFTPPPYYLLHYLPVSTASS